jgi:hypothetical protein
MDGTIGANLHSHIKILQNSASRMIQLTNDSSVLSYKDPLPIQSNATSYSVSGSESISEDRSPHAGVTVPHPSIITMIAY